MNKTDFVTSRGVEPRREGRDTDPPMDPEDNPVEQAVQLPKPSHYPRNCLTAKMCCHHPPFLLPKDVQFCSFLSFTKNNGAEGGEGMIGLAQIEFPAELCWLLDVDGVVPPFPDEFQTCHSPFLFPWIWIVICDFQCKFLQTI